MHVFTVAFVFIDFAIYLKVDLEIIIQHIMR